MAARAVSAPAAAAGAAAQLLHRLQHQQLLPSGCTAVLAGVRALHGSVARDSSGGASSSSSSSSDGARQPLYPTHVPLHPLQKGAVAALSSLGALLRPSRGDLVALVGETFGGAAVRAMAARMRADPVGRQILAERPRVTDAAVAPCWELPPHTFGGAYAAFMGTRGFSADERPVTRVLDDEELAYVITRAREVHDFWHVLTGCHTNVFGELSLKALEFVHTGLPMAGMAVAGAQFKLRAPDRALLWREHLPWAAHTGLRCADLLCIYYEHHFDEDLDELRRRWRVTPAPPPPPHLAQPPQPAAPAAQAGLSPAATQGGA